MGTLSEILERVEAEPDASREIDAELGRWLGWTWASDGYGEIDGGWYPPENWKGAQRGVGRAAERFYVLPQWTASVDAVLDLADRILPGAQLYTSNVGYAWCIPVDGPQQGVKYDASSKTERRQSAALTALGALLRARIAQGETQV